MACSLSDPCKGGQGRVTTEGSEAAGPWPPAAHTLDSRPNPFNPATEIRFSLDTAGPATLAVFTIRGEPVRRLLSRDLDAGTHAIGWDGRGDDGTKLPSGIYLCRMQTATHALSTKMVLLR